MQKGDYTLTAHQPLLFSWSQLFHPLLFSLPYLSHFL